MTEQLVEFFVGLLLVGISISVTKTQGSPTYTKTVDIFKLVFGIILIIIAFYLR